jgi:hypothetical protein
MKHQTRGGILPDNSVENYGKGEEEAQRYADDFKREMLVDNTIIDDYGEKHTLEYNKPIVRLYRAEPVYDITSKSKSLIAPRFKEGFEDTHFHNPVLHRSMLSEYGLNRHASSTSSYTPFISTTLDKDIAKNFALNRLKEFPNVPVKIYTIESPDAIDVRGLHKMLNRNQEFVIAGHVPKNHIVNTETYKK